MAIFYRGTGDKGKSIIGKNKIDKTSVIIKTVGALDELNSLMGLARNHIKSNFSNKFILEIQENLFIIQANLAYFMYKKFKPPIFKDTKTKELEKIINDLESKLIIQRKFIIPGSNNDSAWLDYLRAMTRSCEIQILKMKKIYKIPVAILSYLNRLSSLLYALARYEAFCKNIKENNPKYT